MKHQIWHNGIAWTAALLAAAVTHGAAAASAASDEHASHDHAAPAAAEHDEQAGHDHAAAPAGVEHDEHDEDVIRLTAEQRQRFGIKVLTAGAGSLRGEVRLPGEIVFNEDRVVHLTPRVAGVAREVRKTVGDSVARGEIMVVLDSRELADAKAEHLAARARAALAEKVCEREQALRVQKVSSEQDLLEAEQALAEARIVLRSSAQKLQALGFSAQEVAALDERQDAAITRYELRAPLDGVVAARHVSLGESLAADAEIFTVVDTASVWVNLAVHVRNLSAVRTGQQVLLRVDHDDARTQGTIAMVTPFVAEASRSATARVVVDNADGRWIPGTFVTGLIAIAEDNLPVVVPLSAVQSIEGRNVVFVEHEGGFEMAPVTLGRRDRAAAEVTSGLAPGTPFVAEGAFQLKATVVTSALGSHAGHGH